MERLTKTMRCQDGARLYDISNELFGLNISRADKTRMILEKLADYEDLEEQGRLVKLPCKVGDTVYHVVQGRIVEVSNVDLFFLLLSVAENRFNDSVFLTKTEAEAKLKELRGKNE
jgi:hypothetical protein